MRRGFARSVNRFQRNPCRGLVVVRRDDAPECAPDAGPERTPATRCVASAGNRLRRLELVTSLLSKTSGRSLARVFPGRWAICSTIDSTGVSGVPEMTVLVIECEAFMSGFTFRARTFGLQKPGVVPAAIE